MKQNTYEPRYSSSWALIIGINDYLHGGHLENARSDAEGLYEALTKDLDFPPSNVSTLFDEQATRSGIMERFHSFENLEENARLLVFFAGHGLTASSHRGPVGYLVPHDGRCNDKSSLIRWDELTRGADLIPAKHLLFIMDACYSGLAIQRSAIGGERRFISDMLLRRSRQVVTAGKADEAGDQCIDGHGDLEIDGLFAVEIDVRMGVTFPKPENKGRDDAGKGNRCDPGQSQQVTKHWQGGVGFWGFSAWVVLVHAANNSYGRVFHQHISQVDL